MGEGGVSFSISSEKSFLTIINKMFEAIDDVGIYGMEGGLNNESGKLEISADENDEVRVVGWIALIQKAFCENNLEPFSLKVNGVIDNDFYACTAFEILCDQDSFKFREIEFTSEPSEDDGEYDWDDWACVLEGIEEEAFSRLENEQFLSLDEDELYYDDNEYEAAVEAYKDYVDDSEDLGED